MAGMQSSSVEHEANIDFRGNPFNCAIKDHGKRASDCVLAMPKKRTKVGNQFSLHCRFSLETENSTIMIGTFSRIHCEAHRLVFTTAICLSWASRVESERGRKSNGKMKRALRGKVVLYYCLFDWGFPLLIFLWLFHPENSSVETRGLNEYLILRRSEWVCSYGGWGKSLQLKLIEDKHQLSSPGSKFASCFLSWD